MDSLVLLFLIISEDESLSSYTAIIIFMLIYGAVIEYRKLNNLQLSEQYNELDVLILQKP